MPSFHYLAFILSTLSLHLNPAQATNVSIEQTLPYQTGRPCAIGCLSRSDGNDVRSWIGCGTTNGFGQNECYCRADLQEEAHRYLTKCVVDRCSSNTVDINSVVSMYTSYCAEVTGAAPTPTPATE